MALSGLMAGRCVDEKLRSTALSVEAVARSEQVWACRTNSAMPTKDLSHLHFNGWKSCTLGDFRRPGANGGLGEGRFIDSLLVSSLGGVKLPLISCLSLELGMEASLDVVIDSILL